MAILSDKHRHELETGSAITPDVIAKREYQTIMNPRALPTSFNGEQRKLSGLLIPILNTQGENVAWQLKPDNPREGKGKYEFAGRVCLDVPAAARQFLHDVEADLWITEGSKKVDSAVSNGIPCTVAVLGVWMWQQDGNALPDWRDIALKGRVVVLAFDSDVTTKATVRKSLDEFSRWLTYRGARVRYCLMPDRPDGKKCGLDDYFASGLTRADLEALVVDSLPSAESDWREPIALDDPTGPPFPLDALPGALGAFVEAVATSTQTPPGMAAVMALGAISAAARGRYDVAIDGHDWTEPVLIQTVAFALPGERKSAVVKEFGTALSLWEREQRLEDEQANQEWMSRYRVLKKQLDAAEAVASKGREPGETGKNPEDLDRVRQAAAQELADHEKRMQHPTRIIADDVTPEQASRMIVEQGGALAILSAEGTFFAILAGRYSDSPSLEVMLKGHAGEPITVDRATRPALYTPRGCLTIAVACQPHVAETMGSVDGFTARGGTARILPAFLASAVGTRSIEQRPVSADLRTAWEATIRTILNHNPVRPADGAGYPQPCRLLLDADAFAAFQRYRGWHEPQLIRGGEFGELADWGSKLPGAILRISGLLHIATHERPEDHRIGADTIERAIAIGGYFAAHAKIMYRVMAGRTGQGTARQVLEAIRGLGTPTTKREIHRKLQERLAFHKAPSLNDPLGLLEEYGWIRTEREGKSLHVHLNPYEYPDNTDNADSIVSIVSVPKESKQNPQLDIAPAEHLAPTGTDGALPGEIRL